MLKCKKTQKFAQQMMVEEVDEEMEVPPVAACRHRRIGEAEAVGTLLQAIPWKPPEPFKV